MKSHRPERVANVIRQVVSSAIASKLSDPRIEPLSSVTRVELGGDMEHAKIWVSVMGEESAGKLTVVGLNSAVSYLQRLVGQQLSIRRIPRLSFYLDESIKKGDEVLRLIDEAAAEFRDSPLIDEVPEDEPSGDGA